LKFLQVEVFLFVHQTLVIKYSAAPCQGIAAYSL